MKTRTLVPALCIFLAMLCACVGKPPENPDPAAVAWTPYTDEALGYSLEYPDVYALEGEEDGPGLRLRHDGYPVVSISYVDTEEGKRRGLWAKHDPVGDIRLGGKTGRKYVYHHHDGPFSMRTVSYVVEHEGKYLGLEFRTNREELDGVQRHILDSFRFRAG